MWKHKDNRFLFVALAVALAVPRVSPFAVGATASTAISNSNPRHHQVTPGFHEQVTATRSLTQNKDGVRYMASAAGATSEPSRRRYSIGQFMTFIRGKNDREDSWKAGEETASLPSRLLFRYATPILNIASKRRLDVDDALEVSNTQNMNTAVSSLSTIYEDNKAKSRRRMEEKRQAGVDKYKTSQTWLLFWTLMKFQRKTLLLTAFLRLLNTTIQAFPAILLSRLLRLVEAGNAYPSSKAFGAAMSLVAVLMIKMVTENQYFHSVVKCSAEVRGALSGMIFDKSLRLPGGGSGVTNKTDKSSNKKRSALGTGGVLNLMQSDTSLIETPTMLFHTLWDGPLQIAIYSALLFRTLGPSVLYGIAVLLLTIPLNSYTLRVLNKMAQRENAAKDARTKRTSESITNMKLLKLQGWEQRFAEDIAGHRNDQLRRHSERGVVQALNQAISNSVPALVLVVTLGAYVKTGQPILASKIFTAISLFNQLRFPLFFYPQLIDALANGKDAMRRISSYLSSEEVSPYVEKLSPTENGSGSVEILDGNFLWSSSKPPKDGEVAGPTFPALFDVNLKVNSGEVVAVVGPVGSGKSALVKALLGELVPVPKAIIQQSVPGLLNDETSKMEAESSPSVIDRPFVVSQGNIAYCSQEAWLPKGSIREAVVFGREYNEERYLAAIRDAGLDEDIVDSLEGADSKAAASSGVLSHDTEVGEGGSSLSGGQRARVALARALYSGDDTKVFVLDDCLAALDARVGATVFERLKQRLKKSGAATVLVSNDPNIPRQCDRVVLMQKVPSSSSCSTIVDVGRYDDLIARGHALQSVAPEDLEEDCYADACSPDIVNDDNGSDQWEDGTSGVEVTTIRENTIKVVAGYEMHGNCTTAALHCHADPECHVALEKCPDFIAEQGIKEARAEEVEDEDERDEVQVPQAQPTSSRGLDRTTRSESSEQAPSASKNVARKLRSADDVMDAGAVPRSAYMTYLKAVRKPALIVAMLSAYLLSNGAQFYQQAIVAKWTEVGAADSMASAMGARYLKTLVNAAGVVSVGLWVRSFLTMRVGVRASEFLHRRMLSSVFSAPMSFFDATPSGQILSRFGKEMETVDRGLPGSIGTVLFCFLQIIMSAAALAGVVTPAMVLPIAAVSYMYVKTMSKFRPGARDLKRLETKTRSPIYTHFGEALRGTETIRSIPGSPLFWSSSHRSMTDTNLRTFYSVKALDRWLSCRLETLGNLIVFTAAIASVWLTRLGHLTSGSAAWGLTQSLAITGLMTWAVRCLTDLETNMLSLVRVKELTDLGREQMDLKNATDQAAMMPKEKAMVGEALKPLFTVSSGAVNITLAPTNDNALKEWPWRGDVQLRNVSMRYNEVSDLVLKDVTISISPGTTLGVVGRSGSGKSSLLLTLFRLVEIEAGGKIEIDGIDIRSISLQKLRESLAIIPQDPVLFAGTVGYNLDATGKASSEEMWAALEAASPSMASQFRQSGGLESAVAEGGKNLSQGQRQLLCLARALLRGSKTLVLDEATASVDPKTDQEVQETIRREFVDKGVTVITVAHRLETVLGYDNIAVLGDGRLLEYGSPKELLQKRNGELRQLVDADRRSKRKGAKKAPEAVIQS